MNGNFSVTVPLLSIPGRGSSLDLALHYSSQLWASVSANAQGSQTMVFDPDGDWPSPGWSLGFGRIVASGPGPRPTSAVLVNPDNSRQTLHLLKGPIVAGATRELGIHGDSAARVTFCCYGAGGNEGRTARLVNKGRTVEYFTVTPGANNSVYYPTRITDANGNFITIRYVLDGAGQPAPPAIDTVTDTTGRVVVFNYDASRRLVSIGAPDKESSTRIYARFLYWKREVNTKVGASCATFSTAFDGIFGVVLHGDKYDSGIWIPPSTLFGISYWLYETVGVQLRTPSPNAQAELLSQGSEIRRVVYEYPSDQALTCIQSPPTYKSKTESWRDPLSGQSRSAITTYSSSLQTDGDLLSVITNPDGSINRQFVSGRTDPATFLLTGLVRRIENADKDGNVLSSTDFEWEVAGESYGAPRLRATMDNIDPLARGKRVEFTYDEVFASLVTEQTHYSFRDMGATTPWIFEWSSKTVYARDQASLDAKLIDLPQTKLVLTGNGISRAVLMRTDFEYDRVPTLPVGSLAQHADVGGARGNLTKITRWADASTPRGETVTNFRYDSAGNLRQSFDASGNGVEYIYDPATQMSLPSKITYGSLDVNSPTRIFTSYTYFAGIGLVASVTNPLGNSELINYVPGPRGWRLARRKYPNDVLEIHAYDDLALSYSSRLIQANGDTHNPVTTLLDGRGNVRRQSSAPHWLVDRDYDEMGRLERKSRPYKSGESRLWTTSCFDGVGRIQAQWLSSVDTWPPVNREPCHMMAVREELHNLYWHDEKRAPPAGVSISPRQGSTTRTRDSWGRERWTQRDAQGNIHFVVEPSADNPSDIFALNTSLTQFVFNAAGNIVSVNGGTQIRRFDYDGLGRLTGQKLPEREATLNADGLYVGAGDPSAAYSDTFSYDRRQNLVARVDARGIRTVYDYRDDPLNRIQEIRYEVGTRIDPSSEVLPARGTRFLYATAGDIRQLASAEVPGFVKYTYRYDEYGRPWELSATLAAHPASPFSVTLNYDAIGRTNIVNYPARYGIGDMRRALGYRFEADSLSGVTLDNEPLASDLRLSADGRMNFLRLATPNGWIAESIEIDERLGLPIRQTAVDANGTKILDLEYRYRRQSPSLNGRTEIQGVVGAITAVRDLLNPDLTQDFVYDGLGRLGAAISGESMSAVFDPQKVSWQRYSYDRHGNRIGVQAYKQTEGRHICLPPSCQTVPFDEEHHDGISTLAHDINTNRASGAGFQYDAAGNLIRGLALVNGAYVLRKFKYDAANRLVEIREGVNGQLVEKFAYGSDNRRVGASPDDRYWTYSVWLGDKLLSKYTSPVPGSAPIWDEDAFYLGERLIATEKLGSKLRAHISDQRGVALTVTSNGSTNQAARQGARPYGTESVSVSDWQSSRRFTSYDRAGQSGLDNAVNRQYDPRLGKFLQVDPLGTGAYVPEDPQSLNLFSYGRSDPINNLDPDGQLWIAIWWRYCYGDKPRTDCGPKHLISALFIGDSGSSPAKPAGGGGGSPGKRVPDAPATKACSVAAMQNEEESSNDGSNELPPELLPTPYPPNAVPPGWKYPGWRDIPDGVRHVPTAPTPGWRPGLPEPAPTPQPAPATAQGPSKLASGAKAGGAVLALYVLYRCARMVPSLFPPLWPTIPANVIVP